MSFFWNSLILFFSGVVLTILFTYLLSIYFFKGYLKKGEEIKKKEEEYLFKLNSHTVFIQNVLKTFEKYDLLFSHELVEFLMSNAVAINFPEFIIEVVGALQEVDEEILKDTKIIVLRSITINMESGEKKFVFQPIIPEKNKENT